MAAVTGGTAVPPRWRPDLRATVAPGDGRHVIVEDPASRAFFELDRATFALASSLDGTRSLEEAYLELSRTRWRGDLAPGEVAPLVEELRRHGLLTGRAATPSIAPASRLRLDLLVQRIPLGNPDRLFQHVARWIGWAFGPILAPLWLVVIVAAIVVAIARGDRFVAELGAILSVHGVLLLLGAWAFSKSWHELCHGIVARRYGVEVPSWGVMLLLVVVPLGGYVDATASWRLSSRMARLHIALAGIMGELLLGAVTIQLWAVSAPGTLSSFLQALVVTSTVSAILFNANPLARFDGYHALVDATGLVNLYARGARWLERRGHALLFGADDRPAVDEPVLVRIYGALAWAWRWLVVTTLAVMAAHLLFGFGLAIAGLVLVLALGVPTARFLRAGLARGAVARRTFARRGGATLLAVAMLAACPLPEWRWTPGMVGFADPVTIRAPSAGLVAEVTAVGGARVAPGDLLVRLENPGLALRQTLLGIELERLAIEGAAAQAAGEWARRNALIERARVVVAERDDIEGRIAQLLIRAPADGRIADEAPAELLGRWLGRGQAVLRLVQADRLEVRLYAEAGDGRLIEALGGHDLRFVAATPGRDPVLLDRLEVAPLAASAPPPDALTARGGGPLDLVRSGEEWRSPSPLLVMTGELRANASLLPGEVGFVRAWLGWRSPLAWASERLEHLRGAW